jgi:hypothetical protein
MLMKMHNQDQKVMGIRMMRASADYGESGRSHIVFAAVPWTSPRNEAATRGDFSAAAHDNTKHYSPERDWENQTV